MTIDAETIKTISTVASWGVGLGALIAALKANRNIRASKAEEEKTKAETETERVKAVRLIIDTANEQSDRVWKEADNARSKLKEEQEASSRWKNECQMLSEKMDKLASRVKENETCQNKLTWELEELKQEKTRLMNRIAELETKIEALQEENKRLKQEREIEKAVIA